MEPYNEMKEYAFKCPTCGHEYKDYVRPGAEKCPACSSIAKVRGEYITIK